MTLVVGSIKPDGIVLSSDGRIVDIRANEVLDEKEKKVFFLKNNIYIGISGRGFGRDFVMMLVHTLKNNIDFSPPYTLEDVVRKIINECQSIPSQILDREGFILTCIVAGYDRDSSNRSLKPHLYAFTTNDYENIEEDSDMFMGADAHRDEWYDQIDAARSLNMLKVTHEQIIREASTLDPTVGSQVKAVTIRP